MRRLPPSNKGTKQPFPTELPTVQAIHSHPAGIIRGRVVHWRGEKRGLDGGFLSPP